MEFNSRVVSAERHSPPILSSLLPDDSVFSRVISVGFLPPQMDELFLESSYPSKIVPKADRFSASYDSQLPPRPSLSPRTTSPIIGSDRRSPYFRTHSPLSTYESNRETIVRRDRNSPTLAETHLLHKEGSDDSFYSEEHWASEISAFVTSSPPKFIEVIKPHRVLCTDQFTLLVRVRSDPPAIFSWFFNDKLIPINSQTFIIRNAVNVSTLTVEEPKQGLYACSASNPAGNSKTYGFITVNYPNRQIRGNQQVQRNQQHANSSVGIKLPSQGPNLTLLPSPDARFDVDVSSCSGPEAQSWWVVEDRPVRDYEIIYPVPNRCAGSIFKNETSIAVENEFRASNGYTEIITDTTGAHPHFLWDKKNNYESDTSMMTNPQSMSPISIEESGSTAEDYFLLSRRETRDRRSNSASQHSGLAKFPCKPRFIQVPSITQQLNLNPGEPLVANVNVLSEPEAQIDFYVNEFKLRPSVVVQITRLAKNSATLIHERPVSGIYRIKATNVHGTAIYEMEVTVDGYTERFMASPQSQSSSMNEERGANARDGVCDHHTSEPYLKNGQNEVQIDNNGPNNSSQISIEYSSDDYTSEDVKQPERHPASVDIDYLISDFHPYFSTPLPSSTPEGTKQLSVKVEANETGIFQWLLDDKSLIDEDTFNIIDGDPFTSTLSTTNSGFPPNKEIVVIFTNQAGMIVSKTRTERRPPPVPKKQFKIVNGSVQKLSEQSSVEQTDPIVVEVEKINQDFNETTRIEKQEESYSLLVKVADTVAESLIVRIIVEAIKESAKRLSVLSQTSESEDEDSTYLEQPKTRTEPRFINMNEVYYCSEGETMNINARLGEDLDENTKVEWLKEGAPLNVKSSYEIKITQNNVELILFNVRLAQAGTYECRLSGPYGSLSYFCRLIIRNTDGSATVRSCSPNYVDTSQNINTNIATNKKQESKVIEVILADDIFEEADFTITEDIVISALLKLDPQAGPQKAELTSTDDEFTRPPPRRMEQKSSHRPPKLPSTLRQSTSEEETNPSEVLRIFPEEPVCFVKGEEKADEGQAKESIELNVALVNQGVAFSRAESLIERTHRGLETLVDSGVYTGLLESVQTSVSTSPTPNHLAIPSEQRPNEIPRFVEDLSDVTVIEGSTAQLTCTATGSPSMKWFFNSKIIDEEDGRCNAFSAHGVNGLRFEKITKEDEGRYTCEISNTNGTTSTHAYIAVKGKLTTFNIQTEEPREQVSRPFSSTLLHANVDSDIKPDGRPPKHSKPLKRRSKSVERLHRLRVNAMDSLRNFGQRLQRIRERSFSTRRSRSSQPIPVQSRIALAEKQSSSDLESEWYFVSSDKQQSTESYTTHEYFESEYNTNVFKSENRFLHTSASEGVSGPGLITFNDFYGTPSTSTDTIKRQKSLPKDRVTPEIQKYVDSLCNFDNLMDWASLASKSPPPSSCFGSPTYSASPLERGDESWIENKLHEKRTLESKTEGQLGQCIRRVVEKRSTTMTREEEILESEGTVVERKMIRDDMKGNNIPPNSVPSSSAYNSQLSANNLQIPKVLVDQTSKMNDVFEEEEQQGHRILHGRVFPLSGKISPAPYLLRTNSICKTGLTTDISQEWSLLREPQSGYAEAFFFPYAQSQVNKSVDQFEVNQPGVNQHGIEERSVHVQKSLSSREYSRIHDQREYSRIHDQRELEEQRKLAEFEDYVQRQIRLMDRETQTTPRLRLLGNQTPDVSQSSTPTRLFADSPLNLIAPTEKKYSDKAPTEKRYLETTSARQFRTLPTKNRPKLQNEPNDLALIRQVLLDVEKNAGRAQRRFHKTVSEDALLIEKAILKVSEELQRRGPLSEAQMLASEELLRAKIAEAILNLKPTIPPYDESIKSTPTESLAEVEVTEPGKLTHNQVEQIDILRDPIIKLKEKLGNLEKQIIYDEEESIREELQQINAMRMDESDSHDVKMRQKNIRGRAESVARMTPLIVLVKTKLSHLDQAVDQQAAILNSSKRRSKTPTRLINDESSRSIHKLLTNINDEIAKIHSLCRENKRIDNVNLVVEVLAKVCRSIDAILEAFDRTEEDTSERSTSVSTTTPAMNMVVNLNKPEEVERTNTMLMYWSGAEETHNLSTKVDVAFKKIEENLISNASVKVQEFAHVQNKFKPPPLPQKETLVVRKIYEEAPKQVGGPVFRKVEGCEEIPEIKLIIPTVVSKKSEVRSELTANVQNKSENKQIEAVLIDNNPVRQTSPDVEATAPIQVNAEIHEPVPRRKNASFLHQDDLSKSQEDDVSFSENIPILFPKRSSLLLLPGKETDIISSSDDETNVKIVDVKNNVWEKFKLKKHRRNYRVNAFIYPAVRFQLVATVSANDFQVDLDCESEYFYGSVIVLADSFYASQAHVLENKQRESSDFSDEDTLEADDQPSNLKNYSRMSVSINARSVTDAIQASLEEVPWNEVEATISEGLNFDHFVEARNSGYFNVTVSENHDESKSLKSQESSQRSLAISEQLSQQSIDVPTYIIKQSSTATITVELNPFVQKTAQIEWFRGRKHISFKRKNQHKYSRVREDHLEVLVISDVQPGDSELYSITVNKDIYPVAYLIVEDSQTMKENRYFISPPQTMFVMEGQTAIISCQLVSPNMNLMWYKEDKLLTKDDRHTFQQSDDGWNRLIIDFVLPADQGIYYAYVEDCSTSINLVVEEPIDEKEVQVSDVESEELVDYLIPSGSTATIACELNENDSKLLTWKKDGHSIEISGQNKYEYVQNQAKHFLILHNASEQDSGIYSVLINDMEFKIASLMVGEGSKLAGSRLRQISNSSICV